MEFLYIYKNNQNYHTMHLWTWLQKLQNSQTHQGLIMQSYSVVCSKCHTIKSNVTFLDKQKRKMVSKRWKNWALAISSLHNKNTLQTRSPTQYIRGFSGIGMLYKFTFYLLAYKIVINFFKKHKLMNLDLTQRPARQPQSAVLRSPPSVTHIHVNELLLILPSHGG